MANSCVVKILHVLIMLHYYFGIIYDQLYVRFPKEIKLWEQAPFKGRSIFLTQWCLVSI